MACTLCIHSLFQNANKMLKTVFAFNSSHIPPLLVFHGVICDDAHLICSSLIVAYLPCLQGFLKQGESKSTRCDEIEALIKKGCPPNNVENPRGAVLVNENKTVTNRKKDVAEKLKPDEITQIQPQKLTLNLRAGTS